MGKCDCWEERIEYKPLHNMIGNPDIAIPYGVCLGTREVDRCSCNGDESKCNFYPEKRKAAEKPMNTAEMWLKAQEDGKTYYSKDANAFYSKKLGLVEEENIDEEVRIGDFPTFEHLMKSEWEDTKIMTKAEAEEKYGIRIVN